MQTHRFVCPAIPVDEDTLTYSVTEHKLPAGSQLYCIEIIPKSHVTCAKCIVGSLPVSREGTSSDKLKELADIAHFKIKDSEAVLIGRDKMRYVTVEEDSYPCFTLFGKSFAHGQIEFVYYYAKN